MVGDGQGNTLWESHDLHVILSWLCAGILLILAKLGCSPLKSLGRAA
jgi:hypothetical protein